MTCTDCSTHSEILYGAEYDFDTDKWTGTCKKCLEKELSQFSWEGIYENRNT